MAKVRVHNFSISLDGFGAGPDQSLDNPLEVGGERLHSWAFATRGFHEMIGEPPADDFPAGAESNPAEASAGWPPPC